MKTKNLNDSLLWLAEHRGKIDFDTEAGDVEVSAVANPGQFDQDPELAVVGRDLVFAQALISGGDVIAAVAACVRNCQIQCEDGGGGAGAGQEPTTR